MKKDKLCINLIYILYQFDILHVSKNIIIIWESQNQEMCWVERMDQIHNKSFLVLAMLMLHFWKKNGRLFYAILKTNIVRKTAKCSSSVSIYICQKMQQGQKNDLEKGLWLSTHYVIRFVENICLLILNSWSNSTTLVSLKYIILYIVNIAKSSFTLATLVWWPVHSWQF